MPRYGQFCPVAKSAEILGDPWSILIIRELLLGSTKFSELQRGLPRISPTVLNTRLKDLERNGVLTKRKIKGLRGHAYHLTVAGKELEPVLETLVVWGMRWARENMEDQDYDATFLMFDLQRNFDPSKLPGGETVLCFQFSDLKDYKTWWLLCADTDVDICYEDPGKEGDIYITAELKTLVNVYMGDRSVGEATASGDIKVIGDAQLERRFSKWFPISEAAAVPRAK